MINNRYFIIEVNDPKIKEIQACCFGIGRVSNDGLLMVVKLPIHDHETHHEMSQYKEHSHAEILKELDGENWVSKDFV